MTIRVRKLLGSIALVAITIVCPLLAAALAQSGLSPPYVPAYLSFLVLLIVIWLVPAGLLIRWMQRPDEIER